MTIISKEEWGMELNEKYGDVPIVKTMVNIIGCEVANYGTILRIAIERFDDSRVSIEIPLHEINSMKNHQTKYLLGAESLYDRGG